MKIPPVGDVANSNEWMRLKRHAVAAKTCLEKEFGIAGSRIETGGKGQTEPLAPNNTVGGKAKNRRGEFVKL